MLSSARIWLTGVGRDSHRYHRLAAWVDSSQHSIDRNHIADAETYARERQMILRPYDDHGRFVLLKCRNPECVGRLVHMGDGWWECDGLVDPDDPSKELECCCGFDHYNGDPYTASIQTAERKGTPDE